MKVILRKCQIGAVGTSPVLQVFGKVNFRRNLGSMSNVFQLKNRGISGRTCMSVSRPAPGIRASGERAILTIEILRTMHLRLQDGSSGWILVRITSGRTLHECTRKHRVSVKELMLGWYPPFLTCIVALSVLTTYCHAHVQRS